MNELTPEQSAKLARNVYVLVDIKSIEDAISLLTDTYGKIMDVEPGSVTKARSGGPAFIKCRTAFGLCVFGKGHFEGHAFIVLRGTKFLADWLTNLNVGTSRSAYGQSIHDGFHQAFLSMKSQLQPFIDSLMSRGVHSVHCIGHSLGGALATVCAEYVKSVTRLKPYLYSFGAPRVGMRSFADMLSSKLGPERIFRVYHRTDIVPCIPFWPFVHAPTLLGESYDYFQPSPGDFPSAEWHDMGLYVKTVGLHKWSGLRGKRYRSFDTAGIEDWLNKKGPVFFNVTNLEWLDKALNYVLSRCLKGVGDTITGVAAGSLTLMDRLAFVLKKGIDLSDKLSDLVMRLLYKVMSMLGMKPVLDKANATHIYIRTIFQNLLHRISGYCQRILDQALVNGQNA